MRRYEKDDELNARKSEYFRTQISIYTKSLYLYFCKITKNILFISFIFIYSIGLSYTK